MNTVDFLIEDDLKDMKFMFLKCTSLKRIEFLNIETSKVYFLAYMFQGCSELE